MGMDENERLATQLRTRPLPVVFLETFIMATSILAIVAGNLLVLLAIYRNRRLRRPANFYIVSLALTDLLLGVSVYPLIMNSTITGHWELGSFGCDWVSILNYILSEASILTVLLIAVNRYFRIVKSNKYSNVFSLRFIIASILLAWVFAIAFPLTVLLCGVETSFHSGFLLCAPVTKPENMTVLLTTLSIWSGTPICLTTLLYYKIWVFIRHHNANMNGSQVNPEELKLTKSLLVVVGSFLVFYSPYVVTFTVELCSQLKLPREQYYFCSFMVMASSYSNPLIYAAMNRESRKEFLKIITSCCFNSNTVGVTERRREFPEISCTHTTIDRRHSNHECIALCTDL